MFNLVSFTSVALLAASSVSGVAIPSNHRVIKRATAPSTYAEGYLEDYTTYHTRYLALDCEDQHGTTFFDQCCHPLLATEDLATARPAQCIPSSSASASAATSTATDDGDDEDCEDESAAPASATSTFATSTEWTSTVASTPTAEAAVGAWASSSSSSSSDWTPTTTSSDWTASSTADAWSSAASAVSSAASSITDLITGGFGTYFYQNGVAGACGTVHSDSDYVLAMDSARYTASNLCGKQVQITNTANQKTVTATVADECPTCNNENSIDMSVGAFTAIADESTGLIDIAWKILD